MTWPRLSQPDNPHVAVRQLLAGGADRAAALRYAEELGLPDAALHVGSLSLELDVKRASFHRSERLVRRLAQLGLAFGAVSIVVTVVILNSSFVGNFGLRSGLLPLAFGLLATIGGLRHLLSNRRSVEEHMADLFAV